MGHADGDFDAKFVDSFTGKTCIELPGADVAVYADPISND